MLKKQFDGQQVLINKQIDLALEQKLGLYIQETPVEQQNGCPSKFLMENKDIGNNQLLLKRTRDDDNINEFSKKNKRIKVHEENETVKKIQQSIVKMKHKNHFRNICFGLCALKFIFGLPKLWFWRSLQRFCLYDYKAKWRPEFDLGFMMSIFECDIVRVLETKIELNNKQLHQWVCIAIFLYLKWHSLTQSSMHMG